MSTATTRIAAQSARLSADGTKIVLGPGPAGWSEFCQSLPRARWNQTACCWTCDLTPAAAWRVCGMTELVSPPLSQASGQFLTRLRGAHGGQTLFGEIESIARELGVSFNIATGIGRDNIRGAMQPRCRKTEGWHHQLRAFWFAEPLDAALLAMDMGTGKSKVGVDLIVNWDCQTVLILCPVSVRGVWRREIERHAGRPISVCVLEKGTTKDKVHVAEGALRMGAAVGQPVAVIVNYETAWRKEFADWSLARQWDCVICDESHRIKSHNAAVSKYAAQLFPRARRRLCLTGTPLAQSPLDLFGQFRFLDPGLFGTSWHHFSTRYAIKGNPYIPQQITGYKNQDELHQRFALLSYRCKAADVLDLPEALHEERTCKLSPEARKAYRQLEEELIADLGDGVVAASNALVRLLRLQQVTSGFLVEDETDTVHRLDVGKQALLAELLEDAGGGPAPRPGDMRDEDTRREPFVVFCRFREDLASVRGLCLAMGLRYGELSGRDKGGLTDRGEMSPAIDVLGCQIQSGGVGIDLTRARYAVYYSLGFSLSEYEQSLARLHRPGQKRNVVYYHLISEGTVDRRVYGALRARKDVIEAVLEGLSHGEDSDESD